MSRHPKQTPSARTQPPREQNSPAERPQPLPHRLDPADRHYPDAEEMRTAEPASRTLDPDDPHSSAEDASHRGR